MRTEVIFSETIPLFLRDRCTKEEHYTRADSLWRSYKTWLYSHDYNTSKKLARKQFLSTLSSEFGYPPVIQDKSVFVVGLRISRTHISPKEGVQDTGESVGNKIFERYNNAEKHKGFKPPAKNLAFDDIKKNKNFITDDIPDIFLLHSGDIDQDIADSVASIRLLREGYAKRRGFTLQNLNE